MSFLRPRRGGRAAEVFPGSWDVEDRGWHAHVVADGPNFLHVSELDQQQAPNVWLGGALANIANYQPSRVLAECAAKRELIEIHTACDDVSYGDASTCPEIRIIAAVYKDHPDYQDQMM